MLAWLLEARTRARETVADLLSTHLPVFFLDLSHRVRVAPRPGLLEFTLAWATMSLISPPTCSKISKFEVLRDIVSHGVRQYLNSTYT